MKNHSLIKLSIFIILSLVLVGCSSGPPPKTVVENFLGAVQAGDIETAATYVASEKEELSNDLMPQKDEFGEEMAKKIFGHVSYEVQSQQISGEEAAVPAMPQKLLRECKSKPAPKGGGFCFSTKFNIFRGNTDELQREFAGIIWSSYRKNAAHYK